MLPSLSPGGISIAVKFRCDKSGMKEDSTERFIFDTGGWLGRGVSLFVFQGQLTAVLGYKGRIWVVQSIDIPITSWMFVLITWREDMGLYLYINGALAAKEKLSKYLVKEYDPYDGMTIGCNVYKASSSFANFELAMITFYPVYTTVDELMKISPPLIIRPTFDWYFMLIQNHTTLTSPPLTVNGNVVASEDGLIFDGKTGWLNAGTLQESSKEYSEIICEHYEKVISCPSNQTISIAYANYGRTSEIPCQGKRKYIMTNCKSKTTLIMAKALCEGRRECRITALNTYWGNPCPGILKYMDIRYQCVGQILQENGTQVRGAHFMTNPSLSKDGLTVAMNLRLHKDVETYRLPHMVVDSGGQQGNGLSIYTMNKFLICVISSVGKTWKVYTRIDTDVWMYLLVTWSKTQGMILYINGAIQGVATEPTSTFDTKNVTASGILTFGRSTSLVETDTFTRFQISLFTVLRRFCSKSESFRMFSYYVGRPITNAFEASSMSTDMILICEYQSKNISCPADQVIEMVYANYGRTSSRPCAWGTHQDTNCTLPSSTNVAREYCDGHNSCELVAKNSMWKVNPCPGIIKYVELKYICNLIPPKDVSQSKYVGNSDPSSLVIP